MSDPKYPEDPMVEHLRRLANDVEDPFDRHRASRGRRGANDVTHAVTNLFVEYCRAYPYRAGHLWLYQSLATVAVVGGLLAWGIAG